MNHNDQRRKEIVIIGGGYAGTLAAVRLAGRTKSKPVRITLINGLDHFVERIRLHQKASDQPMKKRPFAGLLKNTGINFIQGWVKNIDRQQSTVTYNQNGVDLTISFDNLVYALGSHAAVDAVPGIKEHALTLGSEQGALQLQHVLPEAAAHNGHLLVIGGGLTAIEGAAEIAETYPELKISLVTAGLLGERLSDRARAYLHRTLHELGIEVIENRRIARLDACMAYDQQNQPFPFDLCLWAGSFQVSPLARQSGLPVDKLGRIKITPTLQVQGQSNIYAVGDAAATPLRMACATAMPMAAYAADHIAATLKGDEKQDPFTFAYFGQCISLGRKHGLIQFVNYDDSPKDRIFTGALGAMIKENICRFAYWSIIVEKYLPGSYYYPKADQHPFRGEDFSPAKGALGPVSGD